MGCFNSKPNVSQGTTKDLAAEQKKEDTKGEKSPSGKSSDGSPKQEEQQGLLEGVDTSDPKAAAMAVAGNLTRTMGDQERMKAYITGLKDHLGDDSCPIKAVRCFLKYGIKPMIVIFMFYVWFFQKCYCLYKMLPTNLLGMVLGAGLCICGGAFFATIAAAEAALNLGGEDMFNHLRYVWQEGGKIGVASLADDEVDLDKNDIADVQEMGMNELITHKAKVAMMAVEDPARFQQAIVALLQIWIAVLAVLKIQFARTIALVLGISGLILPMAVKLLAPFLAGVMGKDLCHWAPTVITTTVKVIAIIIAVFVQRLISAVYSGLRGGKMFALCLIQLLAENGLMDKLPESIAGKAPFDPDESYLDEFIAYPLAAVGIYLQVTSGFQLWFPFNILFLPLSLLETFITVNIFA